MSNKNRIWFRKKDLEKILEIIDKFPEQEENYQLEYTNTSGIGYCIDLIMKCETNGVIGELKVPIAGAEDW